MTQNINLIPTDPDLTDLLNYWKKQLKLEFNCHHIGTIQAFNPLTQTAQVTLNYAKTFLQISDVGNTSITTANYQTLADVPCIVLGGGGGYLTFPITSGDECILLFNDRDMDNWFSGSSSSAPATTRLHAFPDAIALVGLRSMANVIVDYDTDSVTLSYGTNKVQVLSDSVKATVEDGTTSLELTATGKLAVTNPTGELLASLVTLMQDIQSATAGGFPLIMPTFTTDLLVLESFKE